MGPSGKYWKLGAPLPTAFCLQWPPHLIPPILILLFIVVISNTSCFLNTYGPVLMPGTEGHPKLFGALPLEETGEEGGENRAKTCEQTYE